MTNEIAIIRDRNVFRIETRRGPGSSGDRALNLDFDVVNGDGKLLAIAELEMCPDRTVGLPARRLRAVDV